MDRERGFWDPSNAEDVLQGCKDGGRKGGAAGKGSPSPVQVQDQRGGHCSGCGQEGVLGMQHREAGQRAVVATRRRAQADRACFSEA